MSPRSACGFAVMAGESKWSDARTGIGLAKITDPATAALAQILPADFFSCPIHRLPWTRAHTGQFSATSGTLAARLGARYWTMVSSVRTPISRAYDFR